MSSPTSQEVSLASASHASAPVHGAPTTSYRYPTPAKTPKPATTSGHYRTRASISTVKENLVFNEEDENNRVGESNKDEDDEDDENKEDEDEDDEEDEKNENNDNDDNNMDYAQGYILYNKLSKKYQKMIRRMVDDRIYTWENLNCEEMAGRKRNSRKLLHAVARELGCFNAESRTGIGTNYCCSRTMKALEKIRKQKSVVDIPIEIIYPQQAVSTQSICIYYFHI